MEYFLPEDLDALDKKVKEVQQEVDKSLLEAGESCQTGHETWHDNPGYEDARRSVEMWSLRLRELRALQRSAVVIPKPTTPPPDGKVSIGCAVRVKSLDTGEEFSYIIGSAMVFDDSGVRISYKSPLGQVLQGKKVGDVLNVNFGGRRGKGQKILVLGVG